MIYSEKGSPPTVFEGDSFFPWGPKRIVANGETRVGDAERTDDWIEKGQKGLLADLESATEMVVRKID